MPKGEDITTKFKVDISDLKKGISEANKQIKLANSEFKKASADMDDWGKSSEGLKAKLTQLKSVLEAQNSKSKNYQEQLKTAQKYEKEATTNVENLRKALDKAKSTYGANSTEVKKLEKELSAAEKTEASMKKQVLDLTVTMNNQEATVKSTEKEMSNLTTSLKDVEKAEKAAAKNGTTVEQELKKIEEQADKTESKTGKLAKSLSKALVAGAVAVGTALVAVGKQAITAYADYEQLVGGVDTLFKNSSKKVQKYAANAYKTAGLSANEYMQTVTSFSASLLQSLGGDTEKAADVADMALTDMADNANKMGTAMSSIQDAYQGFAKQNYTMLDNLKLGYGGTKTEMERLLADAQKITGVKYDISNLNDVYQAIHVIQGELGITGTTALEASTTIQGSVASMKAAWTNLLVGFADGTQNMDTLIANFIDSVGTVAANLIPRIQQVLASILQLVIDHLPQIATSIVNWMGSLVDNIIASLPPGLQEIASVVKDGLVNAFQALVDIATSVIEKFTEMGKWLSEHKTAAGLLAGAIATLTTAIIAYNIQQAIMNAGGIKAVASMAAQKVATIALTGVTTIATAATTAFGAAMAFLTSPVTLVIAAIAALVAGIVLLVKNWDTVKEACINCWEGIKNVVGTVVNWIKENWQTMILFLMNPIAGLFKYLYEHFEGFRNFVDGVTGAVKQFFVDCWEGIKSVWNTVAQWFNTNVVEPIKDFFQPLTDFFTTLFNVIKELAQGCWNAIVAIWSVVSAWFNENVITPVKDFFTGLWNGIKTAASNAWNAIKEVWNVVSGWFNNAIIKPVSNFFTNMWNGLKNGAKNAWEGIKSVFSKVTSWFKDQFTKAWTAVKNVFSTGGKIFDGIKDGITSAFKNVVNAIIRGINKVIAVPFNAINNMLDKIRNVSIAGVKPFSGLISRFNVPQIPRLQTGIAKAKKGHQYLLEGKNDEMVIPLHKNAPWLKALAGSLLDELKTDSMGGNALSIGGNGMKSNVNQYTQNIYANKPLSRSEIYRYTKNLLALKGG